MARIRKDRNPQIKPAVVWRLGLYRRLSKEDFKKLHQGLEESQSIENQDKILRDFVREYFEPGTYEIVDVFTDDGLTGTDTERPDFNRLKGCIERKEINCVIVKSLARAFRNLADQSKFLEEFLPVHGARFINLGEPFIDTYKNPRAVSGFEVPLRGMFNEQFAAVTSEEVRKTLNMKRERGEFIGAFAPYGYLKDPKDKNKLMVDEEAAQVVQGIFHWFVYEGYNKTSIARRLNQMGIPNPTDYKRKMGANFHNGTNYKNDGLWNIYTIYKILKNPVYTGTMVQGKVRVISYKIHKQMKVPEEEWFVVPNTHEAIITQETFDKCQALNQRDTRIPKGEQKLHLFSGFIRCADCDRAMHRKANKGYIYYFCRTYMDKQSCSKRSINEKKLYEAVLTTLQKQIGITDLLTEEIERISKAPALNHKNERLTHSLKQAEKQLTQYQDASDRLHMDLNLGDITREEYIRLKSKYTEQMQQVKQNIACLKEEIQAMADGVGTDNPCLTAFLKHQNIQSLNRGILVELISTIWIHENKEITIDFNFADQYQPIIGYIENLPDSFALTEKNETI